VLDGALGIGQASPLDGFALDRLRVECYLENMPVAPVFQETNGEACPTRSRPTFQRAKRRPAAKPVQHSNPTFANL
jgi:hypothetical protein